MLTRGKAKKILLNGVIAGLERRLPGPGELQGASCKGAVTGARLIADVANEIGPSRT